MWRQRGSKGRLVKIFGGGGRSKVINCCRGYGLGTQEEKCDNNEQKGGGQEQENHDDHKQKSGGGNGTTT